MHILAAHELSHQYSVLSSLRMPFALLTRRNTRATRSKRSAGRKRVEEPSCAWMQHTAGGATGNKQFLIWINGCWCVCACVQCKTFPSPLMRLP